MSTKQISSEEQIKEEVCQFYLNNKTTCDLCYDEAESENIGDIYETVEDKKIRDSLFSQVDAIILTANKYEKNILHSKIYRLQNEKIKKIEIKLFPLKESEGQTYAYWFKWHDYTILHIEAQSTGSYTIGGSADIVRYVIDNECIYPLVFISYGICFGVDEKNSSLWDVVISKKVYPYFIGSKIQEKGYFVNDDNAFKIDSGLSAKIKSVIDKNVFAKLSNKIYFDNYITGEAVVSRKKARDEFASSTTQTIVAGEMEGYGLFKECRGTYYTIPCLIVKSICDWAVMKNFKAKEIFEKLVGKEYLKEKEINTLKDRIQAFSALQAFQVLDILFYNQIFNQSIYKEIYKKIKMVRERCIYEGKIETEIYTIVKEKAIGLQVSDSFIMSIIDNLIKSGLITKDNCAEVIADKRQHIYTIEKGK